MTKAGAPSKGGQDGSGRKVRTVFTWVQLLYNNMVFGHDRMPVQANLGRFLWISFK